MNTQKLAIGGLIVLALALIGSSFRPINVNVSVPAPEFTAGAAAGADRFNPCESTDGITSCFTTRNMNQASTTVCAIKSPTATSTLVTFTAQAGFATTSATVFDVGKNLFTSSNAGATSTTITNAVTLGAGVTLSFVSTTTGILFAPNTYVFLKMDNGKGTVSPTGSCKATFQIL